MPAPMATPVRSRWSSLSGCHPASSSACRAHSGARSSRQSSRRPPDQAG
jgi:hypothetical protein